MSTLSLLFVKKFSYICITITALLAKIILKLKYMKLKCYALRCIAVVCAVVLVACVDDSYDLKDVSTEVTIGQGRTQLFFGELDFKSIKDLIGDNKINGLIIDEEGNLSYGYNATGETEKIEGVDNVYTIPGTQNTFVAEYPSFDMDMVSVKIDDSSDVYVNTGAISAYIPSLSGTLSDAMASLVPDIKGTYGKTFSGNDMHLLFDIPQQLKNIKRVIFRDVENGYHGAPMRLVVDFNGVSGINGGGKINFDIALSGGIFTIVDENNNLICQDNEFEEEYEVPVGADKVEFVIYIESVENTIALNDDHQLDIPMELECNMTFDLDVKAGEFDLQDVPQFALYADFAIGDTEVIASDDEALFKYQPAEAQKINIKNLPKELKSVNKIGFKDDTTLNLYVDGLEWLGDSAENIVVEATLPEYLVLGADGNSDYTYNKSSHSITTTLAKVNDGIDVALESIDFGVEGVSPDAEGTISLDLLFSINAYFVDGAIISASTLVHDEYLQVVEGISDIELKIESLSGKVDYTYTLEQSFDFKTDDYDFGELLIGGTGLSPIITLNIDNPLTLPLTAEASLSDDTGRKLDIDDIVLKAAQYKNNVVVPTKNSIVIALEERRKEFENKDVIFCPVDFDSLLAGTIPSTLDVAVSVGISSDTVHTLYVMEEFEIGYGYSFELPISFNDNLDISYSNDFSGFNEMFADIAEYDVKVGDITIIAEIENTLPLALEAEVELFDANGEAVDIDVTFVEGYDRINGSEDGVTAANSTLRLNIGAGKSIDTKKLSKIDGITFTLVAKSDANGSVAINAKQGVGARLSLELDGGITVDVKDFMTSNN